MAGPITGSHFGNEPTFTKHLAEDRTLWMKILSAAKVPSDQKLAYAMAEYYIYGKRCDIAVMIKDTPWVVIESQNCSNTGADLDHINRLVGYLIHSGAKHAILLSEYFSEASLNLIRNCYDNGIKIIAIKVSYADINDPNSIQFEACSINRTFRDKINKLAFGGFWKNIPRNIINDIACNGDYILECYDCYMEKYSKPKHGDTLKLLQQKRSQLSKGVKHWVYTNPNLVRLELESIFNNWRPGEIISVLFNLEFVIWFLSKGVPASSLRFGYDCLDKKNGAIQLGILEDNLFMVDNIKEHSEKHGKATYTVTNIPFGLFKDFKKLLGKVTEKKSLMIAASSSYSSEKDFEGVVRYRELGDKIFDAKTQASVVIIDHTAISQGIIFVGEDGEWYVSRRDFRGFAPGKNMADFKFLYAVIDKGLPSYTEKHWTRGKTHRQDVTYDPNGTAMIFGGGRVGAKWDDQDAFTDDIQSLSKQFGTYTWSRVSKKDLKNDISHLCNKVYMSGNYTIGEFAPLKFAPKGTACQGGVWWMEVSDENEANEVISYFEHEKVKRLIRARKATKADTGIEHLNSIPHHSYKDKWIHDNYD